MITHKKQTVHSVFMLDGQITGVSCGTRNVYEDAKGHYWVSHLGQTYGRSVRMNEDGSFTYEVVTKTVRSQSAEDVISRLIGGSDEHS